MRKYKVITQIWCTRREKFVTQRILNFVQR